MSTQHPLLSYVHRVPPEIYDLIASHLHVQVRSATLLSFLLTNSRIYQVLLPILYSELIVKTDHAARQAFRIITESDRNLGLSVRDFRILMDIQALAEVEQMGEEHSILRELWNVISSGRIPHLHTFGLTLSPMWQDTLTTDWLLTITEKYLSSKFWESLKANCPQIRSLYLHGIRNVEGNCYFEDKAFNLHTLSIKTRLPKDLNEENRQRILKSLTVFACSLTLLNLSVCNMQKYVDHVMSLTFPQLMSLELGGFSLSPIQGDSAPTTEFWKRHPKLQRLILRTGEWFSEPVDRTLFPNLTHLNIDYTSALHMSDILPQLQLLGIRGSINCQIPYLLRVILPGGLPHLKSLEIGQHPNDHHEIRNQVGAMWYETEQGEFVKETRLRRASRTIMDSYMHSIVRGASGLEELCLYGFQLTPSHLRALAPSLSPLYKLKRIYYRAFNRRVRWEVNDFLAVCHYLAEQCPALESVIDISPGMIGALPYPRVDVVRSNAGSADGVVQRACGFGMHFTGDDDDPFPENPAQQ